MSASILILQASNNKSPLWLFYHFIFLQSVFASLWPIILFILFDYIKLYFMYFLFLFLHYIHSTFSTTKKFSFLIKMNVEHGTFELWLEHMLITT